MYFVNLCGQILRDLWAHKLRSFLALFGIISGTVTVVLLLALGTGFSAAGKTNMLKLVDGTFFVVPGITGESYQGYPKGQKLHLKASVIANLPRYISGIKTAAPMLSQREIISHGDKHHNKEIDGVSDSMGYLQKINIDAGGRFLNPLDIANKAYVVVLGDRLKGQLFGNKPAVGKKVSIGNMNFTVVGVIQKAEGNAYNWYKNTAIIPYTTYINLYGDQDVQYFIVLPKPNTDTKTVDANMKALLAFKYHFNKDDKTALTVFDTTAMFAFMNWFFIGIQIFLGLCGSLTLGVGSLGVANIMFLIVSERTREIGLRLAVGAKESHILTQILLETFIIVGLGGVIGFLLSFMAIVIMQYIGLPDWLGVPVMSTKVVVVTLSVLFALGLVAGIFPARRAAKMDPVEALGY